MACTGGIILQMPAVQRPDLRLGNKFLRRQRAQKKHSRGMFTVSFGIRPYPSDVGQRVLELFCCGAKYWSLWHGCHPVGVMRVKGSHLGGRLHAQSALSALARGLFHNATYSQQVINMEFYRSVQRPWPILCALVSSLGLFRHSTEPCCKVGWLTQDAACHICMLLSAGSSIRGRPAGLSICK